MKPLFAEFLKIFYWFAFCFFHSHKYLVQPIFFFSNENLISSFFLKKFKFNFILFFFHWKLYVRWQKRHLEFLQCFYFCYKFKSRTIIFLKSIRNKVCIFTKKRKSVFLIRDRSLNKRAEFLSMKRRNKHALSWKYVIVRLHQRDFSIHSMFASLTAIFTDKYHLI